MTHWWISLSFSVLFCLFNRPFLWCSFSSSLHENIWLSPPATTEKKFTLVAPTPLPQLLHNVSTRKISSKKGGNKKKTEVIRAKTFVLWRSNVEEVELFKKNHQKNNKVQSRTSPPVFNPPFCRLFSNSMVYQFT